MADRRIAKELVLALLYAMLHLFVASLLFIAAGVDTADAGFLGVSVSDVIETTDYEGC